MTAEDFDVKDAIYQLRLLLADPISGLMQKALNTNWNEEYSKDFDLATTFDCFVDDVNRINTVLQLHDFLSACSSKDFKFMQTNDPNDLDLEYKDEEWLITLKNRIEKQLEAYRDEG